MERQLFLRVTLSIVNSLAFCALANAGPIGGPDHKSDSDSCCSWSSFIEPDTAMLVKAAETDYLANGLAAAGFKAPDWEIQHRQLSGLLTIAAYYAWVTGYPTVSCGGLSPQDQDPTVKRRDGSVFCLDYSPAGADPTGDDVHWIQAVKTDFDPRTLPLTPPDAGIFNAP